ncbi:DUF4129 domain-containing protein [Nocardioides sp.]|uniref:DUF4129 domain-containing protein n=1 Tax=Nocardioides sp. TaxID=35761 RepID=UPI003562CB19
MSRLDGIAMALMRRGSLDPPLDPSPDEARSELRRELLRPEYNEQNLIERFFRAMERQLARGLDAASHAPPLSTLAAMIIAVSLILVVGWLLARARRTVHVERSARAVLTDEAISADQLRGRAEAALAAGRHEDALIDGFRAVATRQVERGRLDDAPGATAHEVAEALGDQFPGLSESVAASGRLFDLVLYGDRPATRAQAASVLALDDELSVRR